MPSTITDQAPELDAIWSQVKPSTLLALSLLHLSALNVPPTIRNFQGLLRISMPNCMLLQWSEDATLSGSHHPKLRSLALVSVTLPSSSGFPLGMLSADFPKALLEVRVESCNLTRLPADLDAK